MEQRHGILCAFDQAAGSQRLATAGRSPTCVGVRVASNAAPSGGQRLARLAGQLHDLGKYTQTFQGRLKGNLDRVDHATWGARIACERYGTAGTLLTRAIAHVLATKANTDANGVTPSRAPGLKTVFDVAHEAHVQLPRPHARVDRSNINPLPYVLPDAVASS